MLRIVGVYIFFCLEIPKDGESFHIATYSLVLEAEDAP